MSRFAKGCARCTIAPHDQPQVFVVHMIIDIITDTFECLLVLDATLTKEKGKRRVQIASRNQLPNLHSCSQKLSSCDRRYSVDAMLIGRIPHPSGFLQ